MTRLKIVEPLKNWLKWAAIVSNELNRIEPEGDRTDPQHDPRLSF